eukprot:jgi/Tetstr1/448562/TSEL_003779.t1
MSIAFRLLLPFIPPGEHAAFARSQQPGSLPSPPPRSPADPLLDAVPLVSASWDSGQRIYADPHARRRPRLGIFRLGAQEARKMPCSMGPRDEHSAKIVLQFSPAAALSSRVHATTLPAPLRSSLQARPRVVVPQRNGTRLPVYPRPSSSPAPGNMDVGSPLQSRGG